MIAVLLVPTYLAPSPIHGIGIFAAAPISAGTAVWRLDEPFDQVVDEVMLARLDTVAQLQVQRYAYLDPLRRVRVLCGDDARFFNHADDANCRDAPDSEGMVTVAVRDVAEGEELTWDYAEQGTRFWDLCSRCVTAWLLDEPGQPALNVTDTVAPADFVIVEVSYIP